MDRIRETHTREELEQMEEQIDVDCESLSTHSSEDDSLKSGESFRQLLG